MHSLNKRAALIVGCFILAFVAFAPRLVKGDEWNLATRFTVNHPFEVPGMVLQANTPYVIRLLDSPSNRNIVQIYNSDHTQMLTMFMAISDERLQPVDDTTFTFIETQAGFPLPMKEWFYPGRLNGLEFVYPKDQASTIASHARESVLAANGTDLHKLSTIEVEAIGPVGTEAPVAETAANITKSEETSVVQEKPSEPEPAPAVAENTPVEPAVDQEQVEQQNLDNSANQIAQNTQPEQPEVQQPAPAPAAPASTEQSKEENQELPRTAGELPLTALIGILCLGGGLGLRVLSTRS